jgi:hypothetical protein
MKINELVQITPPEKEIVLERQALFCRAVEQSAHLFVTNIKAYQPIKKMVKSLSRPIVSIGFPVKTLPVILALAKDKGFAVLEQETVVRIKLGDAGETGNFEQWKESIDFAEAKQSGNAQGKETYADVLSRLQGFPIASHTPFEAMQFVMELQSQLLPK